MAPRYGAGRRGRGPLPRLRLRAAASGRVHPRVAVGSTPGEVSRPRARAGSPAVAWRAASSTTTSVLAARSPSRAGAGRWRRRDAADDVEHRQRVDEPHERCGSPPGRGRAAAVHAHDAQLHHALAERLGPHELGAEEVGERQQQEQRARAALGLGPERPLRRSLVAEALGDDDEQDRDDRGVDERRGDAPAGHVSHARRHYPARRRTPRRGRAATAAPASPRERYAGTAGQAAAEARPSRKVRTSQGRVVGKPTRGNPRESATETHRRWRASSARTGKGEKVR